MKQNSAPLHIHIPTPGDHYSPATGSALMTIIHHVAVCYAAQGGETMLIVNRGTRHDYQPGQRPSHRRTRSGRDHAGEKNAASRQTLPLR